jgi:hypothetical protein
MVHFGVKPRRRRKKALLSFLFFCYNSSFFFYLNKNLRGKMTYYIDDVKSNGNTTDPERGSLAALRAARAARKAGHSITSTTGATTASLVASPVIQASSSMQTTLVSSTQVFQNLTISVAKNALKDAFEKDDQNEVLRLLGQ